jgi:hypothetical protein
MLRTDRITPVETVVPFRAHSDFRSLLSREVKLPIAKEFFG